MLCKRERMAEWWLMKLVEAWGISLCEWRQLWILSFTSVGQTRALIFKLGSFLHTNEAENFPPWDLCDLQDEYFLTHKQRTKVDNMRVMWSWNWIIPFSKMMKKIWYHDSFVIFKLDPNEEEKKKIWYHECVRGFFIESLHLDFWCSCGLQSFLHTTNMSAKKHLAFQTFRGSKSLNLDLMEEGLLDIPSEWYPYPGPFKNWNAGLVFFERLSRRYKITTFLRNDKLKVLS